MTDDSLDKVLSYYIFFFKNKDEYERNKLLSFYSLLFRYGQEIETTLSL